MDSSSLTFFTFSNIFAGISGLFVAMGYYGPAVIAGLLSISFAVQAAVRYQIELRQKERDD